MTSTFRNALLAAITALAACKANESGAIPCNDDSNCPTNYPQCVSGAGATGFCTEPVVGTPGLASASLAVSPAVITSGLRPKLSIALPALTGTASLARKLTLGIAASDSPEPVTKSGGQPVTLADLGTTITVDAPASSAADDKTFTYKLTVSNEPSSAAQIVATGTLRLVPAPVLAAATFAVTPAAITGGLSPELSFALPALSTPASSAANVALAIAGCGAGPVTRSDGAALKPADLGGTVSIAAPASLSSDSKICTYTLTVANAAVAPASTTATGTLTIAPFAISAQPANATARVGGSASFSVSAITAQGALGYQWKKDGAALAGQTARTLTLSPVAAADAGLYTVVVSSTLNGKAISATSAAASLNVAPVIDSPPVNATAAVDGSATFTAGASVSRGTLAYQWMKDGAALAGQTGTSLAFSPVSTGDAGLYSVTVTSTFNGTSISTTSTAASLNVAPVITAAPLNQTGAVGGAAGFSVAARVTTGTVSYQWRKNNVDLPGRTDAVLSFPSLAAGDAGFYSVICTSTFNNTTATTASAQVSLNVAPVITLQPNNSVAAVGGSTAFTVAGSVSAGSLSYQWQKNGSSIANATAATLSLNPLAASDAGLYSVVVTSNLNSTVSSTPSATVSLNIAPVITAQPADTSAPIGGTASFTVAATVSAGTLGYQWQKAGVDLAGQTAATLTINSVAAADAGVYSVNVTSTLNGTAAITSSGAASLNVSPSITSQPANVTAAIGGSASFSVSATAAQGTLSYQWRKDGANLAGKTSANLNLPSVAAADAGLYSVLVTSTFHSTVASTASDPASLNVAPAITSQPADQTGRVGGATSFAVTATVSAGTLGYQWQKGGVDLPGQTAPALSLSPLAAGDAGIYSVNVTSSLNGTAISTASRSAALNLAPVITSAPSNATAAPGGAASFSVTATVSSGTLSYQWQKGGVSIGGATGRTLSFGSVAPADAGLYTVVVTSTFSGTTIATTSTQASLNVAPVITAQPANVSTAVGGSATFSVAATVTQGALSYQWQKDGADLVGQTSPTLSFPTVAAGDAGLYTARVTSNFNGTVISTTSSGAELNVGPTITSQPANTTAAVGGSASFTVTASASQGTLSYQWQKNGATLAGKTSATLDISPVAAADAGFYTVVVTSTLGSTTASTTSSAASLNVAPVITSQPGNQTSTIGGAVSFSVTATATGALSYQWQKGGADLAGQTTATLSLASVAAGDAGSYSVNVTSTYNGTAIATASSAATLNVAPVITTQPANTTAAPGASASFSVVASVSAGTLTYQWRKNAQNLPGKTSATLSSAAVAPADTGFYDVVVTSTLNGTAIGTTSTQASLNVAPVITSQPSGLTVVAGAPAGFSVTATVSAGSLSYQWQKGGADLPGKTSTSLTINAAAAADAGSYSVNVTSTFNNTTIATASASATLAVNAPPVITAQPANVVAAVGAAASFTVAASSGAGTLTYQWKKGSSNIGGATSPTLSFTSVGPSDTALYSVVVTNTLNSTVTSTTSAQASLNVAPVISAQPVAQIAAQGAGASFTVSASVPAGTISYQWQKNGAALADGGNITGSSTATLNLTTAGPGDVSLYSAVVTSQFNSTSSPVTSSGAALTVDNALGTAVQRVGATATVLPGGKVLIAGGGNSSINTSCQPLAGKSNTLEIFDPATGVSTQLGGTIPNLNQKLSVARCGHAAVLVGTSVYFFGGANTLNVDVFDTTTNTLLTSGFPTVNTVNMLPTATLLGANSGSNSGKIVLAGGYDAAGAPLNKIELFTPGAGSVTYSAVLGGGNAGTGRGDHTATLVGKWLVMIGGWYVQSGVQSISRTADAIDTTLAPGAAVVVNSTPAANATPRWGHAAVALSSGSSILTIGGLLDTTSTLVKTMQIWSVDQATGNVGVTVTPNVNMQSVRAYFPVLPAQTTDQFVVFGGTSSVGTNQTPDTGGTGVELIDARDPTALTSSRYQGSVSLSVARQEAAGVVINNGGAPAFFIAGGNPGNKNGSTGTHELIVDQ